MSLCDSCKHVNLEFNEYPCSSCREFSCYEVLKDTSDQDPKDLQVWHQAYNIALANLPRAERPAAVAHLANEVANCALEHYQAARTKLLQRKG